MAGPQIVFTSDNRKRLDRLKQRGIYTKFTDAVNDAVRHGLNEIEKENPDVCNIERIP